MNQKNSMHRTAVLAFSVAVLLMVMSPSAVHAQKAEYEELTKVLEAAQDLREQIHPLEMELNRLRRYGDPYAPGSGSRLAAIQLQREIADLGAQLAARQDEYRTAVARFRRAMMPYVRIQEKAIQTIDYLRKETSGNAVVKKRAIDGILLDLARMNGENLANTRLASWYERAKEALLTGTLTSPIEQELNDLLKDDPALQAAVNRCWNYATDFIRDNKGELLPENDLKRLLSPANAERIKKSLEALDRWYKKVEWGQRVARLIELVTDTNQSDPTAVPALPQLSEFIDLVGDVADEFKGPAQLLTIYLMAIKLQVDVIIEQLKSLKLQFALRNLDAMKLVAIARTDEDGDTWDGLTGGADSLFGVPGPNPKIYPDCTQIDEGEAVSGRWVGSFRYDKSAWMGIMPTNVRHGDETLAGRETIDYVWLKGNDKGQFSFTKKLAPGSYDLRMFDSTSRASMTSLLAAPVTKGVGTIKAGRNGREVQSVTIQVRARAAATAPPRPCKSTPDRGGNENSSTIRSGTAPKQVSSLSGTWRLVGKGMQGTYRIEDDGISPILIYSGSTVWILILNRRVENLSAVQPAGGAHLTIPGLDFATRLIQLRLRGPNQLDFWQTQGQFDAVFQNTGLSLVRDAR